MCSIARIMAGINSHEHLVAWQLADDLETWVFEFTARPEVVRHGDFCDDIRRSARSAPANLAEGFYRFRPRDNARFVRIAIGSLGETLNHLHYARNHSLIEEAEFRRVWSQASRAKRTAIGWANYLDSCPPDGPRRKKPARLTPEPPALNPEP
jgi:four helix bundle protein